MLDGGQLLRHEQRQLAHGAGLHVDQQVVAAGHQVDAGDLLEAVDLLRDGLEALAALGRDAHLDHGLHLIHVHALPVHQRRVLQYDALALQAGDGVGNFGLILAQHHRDLGDGRARVLGQNVQNAHFRLFHEMNPSVSLYNGRFSGDQNRSVASNAPSMC